MAMAMPKRHPIIATPISSTEKATQRLVSGTSTNKDYSGTEESILCYCDRKSCQKISLTLLWNVVMAYWLFFTWSSPCYDSLIVK